MLSYIFIFKLIIMIIIIIIFLISFLYSYFKKYIIEINKKKQKSILLKNFSFLRKYIFLLQIFMFLFMHL